VKLFHDTGVDGGMNSRLGRNVIQISRPCPVSWNDMQGDDRVRYCRHCSLHVYNLSAMRRADAEKLITETEGRLCVSFFFRRQDGTIITRDCEGWRLAARKVWRGTYAAIASIICVMLAPLGFASMSDSHKAAPPELCQQQQPERLTGGAPAPRMVLGEAVAPQPQQILGKVAASQPTTCPADK